MKIGFVIVFVSDFDKSFDFYTNKLGMPVDYTDKKLAQFQDPDGNILTLMESRDD
jgi:predicted enzyme related to lactoylglutathione lyase